MTKIFWNSIMAKKVGIRVLDAVNDQELATITARAKDAVLRRANTSHYLDQARLCPWI